jgi:NADPH:quinone reductase-like Zn-dependent oxidoreductase
MPLDLPHVPGLDVAGTVDALGDGVDGLQEGDPVIGFLPFGADGATAEYVVVAAAGLAPAPTSIPLADAAALPLVGLTAWQALFEHANLQAGQRILVNGASGAVGGYAVQFAKSVGAHVIATATPRTREQVKAQGADEIVDHTAGDVSAAVREPVDVLLNLAPITPDQFATLAGVVRDGGVIVNTTVWMPAPSDEARGVRGIDLFVRNDATQLAEIAARVDHGELTIDIAERVPMTDLPSIHARAADGTLPGKVVVLPISA